MLISSGKGLKALRYSALVLLLVALAAPASAQIYSWRDEQGRLVLADRPRGENGRPAPRVSPEAPPTETMRPARAIPTDRADAYDDLIVEHAQLNGVRPDLVRAVIQVESAFNPVAVSSKGAMGLMQLMPTTARVFGVGNPFNPWENVRAGVAYLRQLLDRYDDNEQLALAAYNAGPGAVDRHGQTIPPYRETRNYVSKINEISGPSARVPGTKIYKTVEIIDGREVIKYSDRSR
jgi:soluble lytic murein transglycosylase-like protein